MASRDFSGEEIVNVLQKFGYRDHLSKNIQRFIKRFEKWHDVRNGSDL